VGGQRCVLFFSARDRGWNWAAQGRAGDSERRGNTGGCWRMMFRNAMGGKACSV